MTEEMECLIILIYWILENNTIFFHRIRCVLNYALEF